LTAKFRHGTRRSGSEMREMLARAAGRHNSNGLHNCISVRSGCGQPHGPWYQQFIV